MIVLDASALIDVVLDQPSKEAVLDHMGQPILAPAHQLAEVLSALSRLVRAGTISDTDARAALDDAGSLQQEHVLPMAEQLTRALDLQGRIRVLDGLYVALAEQRRCPLLTTDRRLAAADPPCQVILAAPGAEPLPAYGKPGGQVLVDLTDHDAGPEALDVDDSR